MNLKIEGTARKSGRPNPKPQTLRGDDNNTYLQTLTIVLSKSQSISININSYDLSAQQKRHLHHMHWRLTNGGNPKKEFLHMV